MSEATYNPMSKESADQPGNNKAKVTMYTTRFCPYCVRAKMLINQKGVLLDEKAVDYKPALRQEMMKKSSRHTVPQIWIGDTHIGGCDELFMLERSGQLDSMLNQNSET